MCNFIDKLFIILSRQLVEIHEKGLCESNNFITENKMVDDFLKLALNLSKEGYRSDIIDSELSFNISKHILNKDIDEIILHSMEIIRKTLQAIIATDYSFLVSYSRYLCSDKAVREIQYDIFDVFSKVDSENEKELLWNNSRTEESVEYTDIIPRKNKDGVWNK